MLKKLYILPTYLIVIQCNNCVNGEITTSTSTTEPTTDNGLVEELVPPLLTLLEKMVKTEDEKARELLKIELEGRIYGVYDILSEMYRHSNKQMEQISDVKRQNINFLKAMKILAVRLKLETLVDFIYPRPKSCTLVEAYEEILNSTEYKFTSDGRVLIFRQRLEKYKMSVASFLNAVRLLYETFNDQAAHKMAMFVPRPEYNDKPGIIKMLKEFIVVIHDDLVKAIQIILEPLPATSAKSV